MDVDLYRLGIHVAYKYYYYLLIKNNNLIKLNNVILN